MEEEDPNVYRNPKRINDPLLIFIFPAVQILPAFVILSVGMMLNKSMEGLACGILWFVVSHYVLHDDSVKDIIHRAWSLGLLDLAIKKTKTVANPFIKRYFS
jgi:hypothetical protein